jgi:hypothetical protein
MWKLLRELRKRWADTKNVYEIRKNHLGESPLRAAVMAVKSFVLPAKKIFFFPEKPHRKTALYKLCAVSGYAMNDINPERCGVHFFREDKTYVTLPKSCTFGTESFLNGKCTDISKKTVDNVFEWIFGYSAKVDPLNYEGKMIVKSNENGVKDGKIVRAPIEYEEVKSDKVYQKEIENRNENGKHLEYRVCIYGNSIPLVKVRLKKSKNRFTAPSGNYRLTDPSNVFSSQELRKINAMAKYMNLDYGECDVLRDKNDGRLFVIDVNKTPYGLNKTSTEESKKALALLTPAFKRLIRQFECNV